MKKLLLPVVGTVVLMACASAPASTPAAKDTAANAEKPKKSTHIITVRIPVETKESVHFADGSLDEYTVSEYDPSLVRILSKATFSASGAPVERIEYAYKGDLLVSKTTKDAQGLVTSRRSYTYDGAGHVIGESLQDGSGKAISSFEYVYDSTGHRSKWIVKDGKGTPVAETNYAYSNGRVRSAELHDGTGKKTGSSAYEYDSAGHVTSQKFFDGSGSLLRIENTLWKDGRVSKEERTTAGGSVQQRASYEYGADGEILRKTVEDIVGKSKQIVDYEYSFREDRRTVED